MCNGATKGLEALKFSGSENKKGSKEIISKINIIKITINVKSFKLIRGLNFILSALVKNPIGLEDPFL